jgi:hypothetical protein
MESVADARNEIDAEAENNGAPLRGHGEGVPCVAGSVSRSGTVALPFGHFCRSSGAGSSYSIFDSALYRKLDAKWLFLQEKATMQDFKISTRESKMH